MPTTTHYSVRPSRLFYFLDGDTIVTCRDRSYRVHSAPLARYSCVMRKALTMGRLPRLWRDLRQDNEGKLLKESGDCVKKRRVGGGARARARDIRYLVTLDDSVQSVDLLFWCIYECRYGILFSFGMIFTPDLTLSQWEATHEPRNHSPPPPPRYRLRHPDTPSAMHNLPRVPSPLPSPESHPHYPPAYPPPQNHIHGRRDPATPLL